MPNCCAVSGCKFVSRKQGPLRFYRFPKDEKLRCEWVHLCKSSRSKGINPSTARICSRHFEPSAYERNLRYELLGEPVPDNQIRFRPGALPTLHLPTSSEGKDTKQPSSKVGKVKMKEEPAVDQTSSSHLPSSSQQPSGANSVCNLSEDALSQCDEIGIQEEEEEEDEEEDVCIKDEPIEDVSPLSSCATFVPAVNSKPSSTRVEEHHSRHIGVTFTTGRGPAPPSVLLVLQPSMAMEREPLSGQVVSTNPGLGSLDVAEVDTSGPKKKKRKVTDLRLRTEDIVQHEDGNSSSAILGLSHPTLSTILEDKHHLRKAVKGSAHIKSTITTKKRQRLIPEVDKLVMTWIEGHMQRRLPLSQQMIQARARSIFETLKARSSGEYGIKFLTFLASNGWFQRFKRRFQLNNVKVSIEAAGPDVCAADIFRDWLDNLITSVGYLPEQIFNVDETGLYWKKIAEGMHALRAKTVPGLKAYKDRLTLLLGGNVAGFKVKPYCIYTPENSPAFKNTSKHTLPVHLRSSVRGSMTEALFEDWFLTCFIPQVHEYCLENSIPFKVLLLLVSTRGHPVHIDDLHPNVKVIYLPPNTSAILQPMDQGAMATFKALYLRATFTQAVAATEDQDVTLCDFWKQYNILQCIENCDAAWGEVTAQCMNEIWKKCLSRYVHELKGSEVAQEMNEIVEKISKTARTLELEVGREEVEGFVNLVPGELTNEELIELEEQRVAEEQKQKEEEEDVPEKKFTLQSLAQAFTVFNQGLELLESMDMNTERYAKVNKQIQGALRCYREIYDEKKKRQKKS